MNTASQNFKDMWAHFSTWAAMAIPAAMAIWQVLPQPTRDGLLGSIPNLSLWGSALWFVLFVLGKISPQEYLDKTTALKTPPAS